MRSLVSSLFILGLVGCNQAPTDLTEVDEFGRIAGMVTDLDGNALADVMVEAQDMVVLTDADGAYVIDGVEPAAAIIVEFKLDEFAKSYANVALQSWETATANTSLMPIDGKDYFEASAGGTITVGDVDVEFQPGTIIDANGDLYGGTVTVAVTHVDPYTTELAGAPGDLTALGFDSEESSAKNTSVPTQLISYGMVDVTLTDEVGEELNMEEDTVATVFMPITNPEGFGEMVRVSSGDQMNTWSFDRERGRWIEEGVGDVFGGEQGLRFRFEASHFSWWNCDQGNPPSCATGRVIDYLGYPIRGAEVRCDGGMSNSVVTTDEDGYYVCSILVGDTVNISSSTHVAYRNWVGSAGSTFMGGYGSSAADCQPIATMQIDVCRVTGAVNVENTSSVVDADELIDSDHISATFWEPLGDPLYCDNPWDAVDEGDCLICKPDTTASHFPSSAMPGVPADGRSVGSYLEVSTGRAIYRMDKETQDGQPFYNWKSHTGTADNLVSQIPEFNAGDQLDVSAPGDSTDYLGPWNESRFATVPTQLLLRDAVFQTHNGSGTLDLSYTGADGNSNGAMVFGTVEDSSDILLCRLNDNGNARIPASALNQMSRGFGGISVYHMDDAFAVGPDGMPIRLQIFSGSTTVVELQ